MSYYDDLKSPKWQKKRLEILDKHFFSCQECQTESKQLHVHHMWYESGKKAWDYPDQCYKVLCEDCHNEFHKTKLRIEKYLSTTDLAFHKQILELIIKDDMVVFTLLQTINVLCTMDYRDGLRDGVKNEQGKNK